jgi:hypothetical protein
MLDYENVSAHADIRFERVGDVLTIELPKEGFVRGAGTLLRSRPFWILLAFMLVAMNFVPILSWVTAALRGNVRPLGITSESIASFFLHPAVMVCVYLIVVTQNRATIRLYRTELVRTVYGILGSARETAYDRNDIDGVRVRWLGVSIVSPRSRGLWMCHSVPLFTGRTREERERVAAAIRTWLDERPAGL